MSLSFGILGLLSYSPMSGYDLKKTFDDSVNFFWSAQTSQIYRELKNLEKKGCVVSEIAPGTRGPKRRIYTITDKGRSSLVDWLSDVPERIDEDNRNAFLMRVFFSSHVGVDELIFQLEKRLRKYRKDLSELRSVKGKFDEYKEALNAKSELPYWRIALSRGFHDVESHIRWAEESLDYLKGIRGGEETEE